ncbi:MAG: peptidylprolyl isomerase [Candidatus Moraniibacteriota bacterium]
MRRKVFGAILVVGAFSLAGCTTPEVRKDPGTKDSLSFYSDAGTPDPASPEKISGKTPQPPPLSPSNDVTGKKMYTNPPQMTINKAKNYTATLKTDVGDIVVALTAEETPITVNNFVFLAREKFYDNTIFHRTIKGFMIQGGDPDGTGRGGPGYKFADESFTGEYVRGTVAMANAGPDTNGSQFFIMHGDNALPPNYVIFGKVISGMEAVDKIATAPTKPGGEESSPVTPVRVQTIGISEQ